MAAASRLDRLAARIRGAHEFGAYGSRYGPLGTRARTLVLTAIRAYTYRQRQVDEEILEALRDVDRRFLAEESLPRDLLTGGEAISADTDLGPLWLDTEEQLIRPTILAEGRWDPALSEFLRRTLRPGMCVLDVGANIGYLTIVAARSVTETGRVIAVEPEPYNVSLLRANVYRSKLRNVVVLPVAAHRASTCLHLTTSPFGRSTSITRTTAETDPAGASPVVAVRLDDLMDELLQGRPLDLVKIDAEGADHLVVAGLEQTLAAHPRCVVVVEVFTGKQRLAEDPTPLSVLERYRELGYALELIDEHGSTRPVTPEELMAMGARDEDVVLNVALRRPASATA